MKFNRAIQSVKVCLGLLLLQTPLVNATDFNFNEASFGLPHIYGSPENAEYLYTTAGEKLYCIGNQQGGFPKVGFHVPGQMGGVWQHPIKLMDGFELNVINPQTKEAYPAVCDSFVTYPFLSKFISHIPSSSLSITRTQFVPDNLPVLVVEYSVKNTSNKEQQVQLELNSAINLMPVWLSERLGITDQKDKLLKEDKTNIIQYFQDSGNNWFTGIGFDDNRISLKEIKPTTYADNGIIATSSLVCTIPAGKSYTFKMYVSGSTSKIDEIQNNINQAKTSVQQLFLSKKQRYESIAATAQIQVPDKEIEKAYLWGKYATDWLKRSVPELGRGLSAGLPDYPWFFSNDQGSTFMSLVGTMNPQLFYDSFDMLKRVSNKANNSNGSIVHEISSNGIVFAKDRMEESQLHIISAWEIFKWTGNMDFLKENYEFAKKTWVWLQQHDTNHNGYFEGNGGVEIEGLDDEMLDVQINSFRFLEVMSEMAAIFNDKSESKVYAQKAAELKAKINADWWIESENRYADFISSKEKALKIINDALTKRVIKGRNDWAQPKLEGLKNQILNNTYPYKGYVVYYNASGLPMNTGIADEARTKKMLEHASFFTNKFGEYIAGIERPDKVTIDEKRFKKDSVFTYNRAVMPAATSGLTSAAARLGMSETALMYMHKTINSFSFATPGTIYEVSPDYGMFVQAWNVTGINTPLIHDFFGVEPNTYQKEITIHLRMPKNWNYAKLNDLLIGNNKLSIDYKKRNAQITCKVRSTESGWKIRFVVEGAKTALVNKKNVQILNKTIELKGLENTIQFK